MIDLYEFKFKYNHKKYDKVTYNKVIFKGKPYPFNILETRVILGINYDFIGIDKSDTWWNWWELVPKNNFKKPIYWLKFYIWYFTKFKKLSSNQNKIFNKFEGVKHEI